MASRLCQKDKEIATLRENSRARANEFSVEIDRYRQELKQLRKKGRDSRQGSSKKRVNSKSGARDKSNPASLKSTIASSSIRTIYQNPKE